MVEILVLAYASEHDLKVRSAMQRRVIQDRKAQPGEVFEK
jgi:hypothetical protein